MKLQRFNMNGFSEKVKFIRCKSSKNKLKNSDIAPNFYCMVAMQRKQFTDFF